MKNPLAKDGYAPLFTVQNRNSLRILNETGRFTNQKNYIESNYDTIAPHFIKLYDYFVIEAQKRIPKPADVHYPIWCSPDKRSCMRPSELQVLYILRVPESEIIYFDGSKWDYVLNHHYVPKNAQDLAAYEEDIKKKGLPNSYEFFSGRYAHQYPLEVRRIVDSWPRIFEIDEWNIFAVQANLWEIKEEWILRTLEMDEDLFEAAAELGV